MAIKPQKFILYPNAHRYMAVVVILTWIGLVTSYFSRLRQNDLFHHVYGVTAGLWMLLLIVQPILYQRCKIGLHRKVGKVSSIILVPLLVFGAINTVHMMLQNASSYPPNTVFKLTFINTACMILFVFFFSKSIWHSKNIHYHARYMACTAFTIWPPTVTKLLFVIPSFDSFLKVLNGSFVCIELAITILVVDDLRNGGLRKPYLVALLLFVLLHVSIDYAGNWIWWQQLMGRFGG